jgi:hypothetical protein
MGLFDSLFNRRDREIQELMNPALAMKLREFVIVDDDPNYVKHYFKFRNKEGADEEFITVYRRVGSHMDYLRTMSRRAVWGPEFQTLSESGPWSMTITYLIEQGQRLSATTRPTRGHFAAKIESFTPSQRAKTEARPVAQPKPADTPSPVNMDAVRAFSGEVRKNPKGYTVWMHEPNPDEFAVLLVTLDGDGSMTGGWSLGSFSSRKEQGAFGLEVARELQISLNDLVPISGQNSTASSDTLSYSIAEPGKWEILGGGPILDYSVARTYSWSGSPSPNATATLRIECGLTSFEANRIPCSLRLNFRPFQIERTTTLVMALFTEELKGGLVEVQARPIPQDARSKLLDIALNVHEDDVPKCLNALCAGTPFCFGLIKPVEPPGKSFLDLPPDFMVRLDVPNDLDFKRLYEQSYAQIERSHEATRARHLREGWYRRRTE